MPPYFLPKFSLPQQNFGMNKSSFFSGQPVFGQLVNLIPVSLVRSLVRKYNTDHYYKTFRTWDHLVTMLYASFHDCGSLREVTSGLQAHYNKLDHLRLKNVPRRSTLADANSKRDVRFFEDLYHQMYLMHYRSLPDSRRKRSKEERLFIMDSTTVTLFTDIMKGAGTLGANGKKKGGAKAHVLLEAKNDLPALIYLSHGSQNDRVFMPQVKLPPTSILVFDKGYHKFSQWESWHLQGINWVTRLNNVEVYEVLQNKEVSELEESRGVKQDQVILLGRGTNASTHRIRVRLVTYYDEDQKKEFEFLTNNMRFNASTIASFYKSRWQIETFFRKFKQTSPVKYFLGDNENAVKIQLWVAFIKHLLLKIIKDKLKRKWSFANLSSMVRHHLMNYIRLIKFLNEPEKALIRHIKQQQNLQAELFP